MIDDLPDDLLGLVGDEQVPVWRPPMLATLTDDRFSDSKWIFERKLDGVRCLAFRDGRHLRLCSRNRQPLERVFPELIDALEAQNTSRFVLDGEVVAFKGRRTSFERLQGRIGLTDPDKARGTGIAVFYYVFDLMHVDGRSTIDLPLTWRKKLLRNSFEFTGPLRLSTHRLTDGEAAYRTACERGDEGVIAKRADSKYEAGRSRNWLKFKCVRDQEFVVGGYTAPRGSRVGLGALLVGYHDGRDLVYAGKVGTGFDTATLRSLHKQLSDLEQEASPFTRGRFGERDVRWVRPEMVAQIGFAEWTRDGKLRHPRYAGLRTDKSPDDVVRETS